MGEPIIRTAKVSDSSGGWWNDLPYPLEDVRVYSSVRPIGFRFRPFAYNISAKLDGAEILVTGEANSNELAITKAVAELVERSQRRIKREKSKPFPHIPPPDRPAGPLLR